MATTFVIGDIHGCHRALTELWRQIAPRLKAADTVVFLGDYIDRGPESRQVIDMILGIRKDLPRVITLMGNHEQMLLDYVEGRERTPFLAVGGAETVTSYGQSPGGEQPLLLPTEHERFFRELLPYWQDGQAIYVHAGLMPGQPLALQPKAWLLWAREEFLASDYDFGKLVIHGHTPFPSPRQERHRIGIDTGAVYGGHLTCLILPEMEFIRVPGTAYWPH
jgi:serine/threonine protein phosphatase 1